jgi:1-acyl-sn-glycerol-3-phosphate acyltransferase/ribosomal protein S27AE
MTKMDELQQAIRFDMVKKPFRQKTYLKPLTWIISFPTVWKHHLRINRVHMEGVKPPYLLLCTHMAFMDFMVTTAAVFPHRANYVVAIDGFIGRERLLRLVGGICKRKFTNDIQLVRQIRHVVVENKDILALYPEARYSLVGTTAVLPASLGKMAKLLGVPVVVLNIHGNYLNSPVWNLQKRGNRIEADFTHILSVDDLKTLSVPQINERINKAFEYDEYRWQKANNIRIDFPKRAEGLHKVLYQCPHCLTEYHMTSKDARLMCGHCGKEWEMGVLGEMEAKVMANDEDRLFTEFPHIPDWYEFERTQVRCEVEADGYACHMPVIVDALPNAEKFIRLGEGELVHDMSGFHLKAEFGGVPFELVKPALSMYSCHIEYEYFGKGDCIDLSTLEDTYYIFPQSDAFSVTKMALATEELFAYHSCPVAKVAQV